MERCRIYSARVCRVAESAARALGWLEDERAVGPLCEAAADRRRSVRAAVILALGHIGLVKALSASDPETRFGGILGLGLLKEPSAVEGLRGALRDQEPDLRHLAVWALEKIGGNEAAEAVACACEDPCAYVRDLARETSGRMGGTRAAKAGI